MLKDGNGATQIWMKTLSNKSGSTKNQYMMGFQKFLDWSGKSPDELREMKYRESMESKPWLQSEVENLVRQFMGELQKQSYSGNYQNVIFAGIRSFFNAQNMPLNLNGSDRALASSERASGVPTRGDTQHILNSSQSVRTRALIMFLKDTGLRESDVEGMLWRDLKDWGDGFYGFKVVTKKRGVVARGFIGPEASKFLLIYKRQRLQGSRSVAPEENIDEHPLFCPDPISGKFKGGANPMTAMNMSRRIHEAIKLAGFNGKYTAHGLRKFWEQNVKAEREAYIKQLNGRKLTKTEKAYYWRTDEQLFELYLQNYENLKIFGAESEAISELQQRYDELYRKYEMLKNQLDEQEDLKKRLVKVEERLGKYVEGK